MPDINTVQPGDLITAQDVNEMINQINELTDRVQTLEGRVQDLEQKTSEVEGPFADIPEIDFGRAIRLRAQGINSLQDLSGTEMSTIREALEVTENEASTILGRVNNLIGPS